MNLITFFLAKFVKLTVLLRRCLYEKREGTKKREGMIKGRRKSLSFLYRTVAINFLFAAVFQVLVVAGNIYRVCN